MGRDALRPAGFGFAGLWLGGWASSVAGGADGLGAVASSAGGSRPTTTSVSTASSSESAAKGS